MPWGNVDSSSSTLYEPGPGNLISHLPSASVVVDLENPWSSEAVIVTSATG